MKDRSIKRSAAGLATWAGLAAGLFVALSGAARAADGPGGPGDHLVFEGKRVVWASQVRNQRAAQAPASSTVKDSPRLSATFSGKRAVPVINGEPQDPQLAAGRRNGTSTAVSSEKPARRSGWRLVEEGKRRWYVRDNGDN